MLTIREVAVSEYPQRVSALLGGTPLYAIGNASLLDKKAISICGSRDASDSALRWAYEFGREAAVRLGWA